MHHAPRCRESSDKISEIMAKVWSGLNKPDYIIVDGEVVMRLDKSIMPNDKLQLKVRSTKELMDIIYSM